MTDLLDDGDEFTELRDADVPRVDLVSHAANGVPGFLVMKQDAAGLMDPDLIRGLLAKSEPEPVSEETVTMSGSPAAIAKLIHQAAQRAAEPVGKAEMSTAGQNDLPDSDFAYIEPGGTKDESGKTTPRSLRHFPINDAAHVRNALARAPQSPFGDKAMSKIHAAAEKFGVEVGDDDVSKMVVDLAKVGPNGYEHGWIKVGAPGESEAHKHLAAAHQAISEGRHGDAVNHLTTAAGHAKDPEAKKAITAMRNHLASQLMGKPAKGKSKTKKAAEDGPEADEGVDGLDPTVPLAAPDEPAPGDPAQPGSPAWEAIDAATARKWTSILVRAKNALGVLADRELMEAACADPGDAEAAFDLRGAQCAIDCAIDVLAGFAVDEQAEVDLANDAQAVAKALDGFDPTALDTLEVLAPVRKAGRTLSAANELAIRQAVESLTKVLASLPQPQPDEADQPVAKKEETMLVDPTTTEETTDAAAVEKAAGEPTPLVPVYDAAGRLVGVVDPGNLTPVVCPDKGDDMGDEDMPTDTTDADGEAAVGDEVAAAEQEMADMEPAPPASVGTPADAVHDDDVAKTTEPNETDTTTSDAEPQSSIADLVKAELDARSATQEEVIAKQAATLTEMAKTIETLNARIHTLEEQPAEPKVFTNGAVPPNIALRGQDRGAAQQIDMAKAQEMRKGLYSATHASEQNRIAQDMQGLAIVALEDIHNRRVPQ